MLIFNRIKNQILIKKIYEDNDKIQEYHKGLLENVSKKEKKDYEKIFKTIDMHNKKDLHLTISNKVLENTRKTKEIHKINENIE